VETQVGDKRTKKGGVEEQTRCVAEGSTHGRQTVVADSAVISVAGRTRRHKQFHMSFDDCGLSFDDQRICLLGRGASELRWAHAKCAMFKFDHEDAEPYMSITICFCDSLPIDFVCFRVPMSRAASELSRVVRQTVELRQISAWVLSWPFSSMYCEKLLILSDVFGTGSLLIFSCQAFFSVISAASRTNQAFDNLPDPVALLAKDRVCPGSIPISGSHLWWRCPRHGHACGRNCCCDQGYSYSGDSCITCQMSFWSMLMSVFRGNLMGGLLVLVLLFHSSFIAIYNLNRIISKLARVRQESTRLVKRLSSRTLSFASDSWSVDLFSFSPPCVFCPCLLSCMMMSVAIPFRVRWLGLRVVSIYGIALVTVSMWLPPLLLDLRFIIVPFIVNFCVITGIKDKYGIGESNFVTASKSVLCFVCFHNQAREHVLLVGRPVGIHQKEH